MHRLFLDQNLRIEIAASLRQDGHTVVQATDAGLGERDDETIFQWSAQNRYTIVTFDVDFAERAYWSQERHDGIVRLRIEPQTPEHVLPVLRRFFAVYSPDDLKNALVILTEKKVRIRRQ